MSGFLPMLFVRDVEASSRWYQQLFGLRSGHGGPEFEMLVVGEHEVVLQLHKIDADEHGTRVQPGSPNGLGVLLNFEAADVDEIHGRAVEMGAAVEGPPTYNELAGHTEFVVCDLDGYAIAVHSPYDGS